MLYPPHFPHGCPPEDSEPALGDVYRLVENNPPIQQDFLSYQESNPDKDYGNLKCHSVGLSVYRDINDIHRLQRRVPAKKEQLISKGALSPEMGKIKSTIFNPNEKSHITWWVPTGIFPWMHFTIVEGAKAF